MSTPIDHAIQPYLFFGGRCEEALKFYQTAADAKIDAIMYFNQSPTPMPEGCVQPGFEDKVMHARFSIQGAVILASDGVGPSTGFNGFSLALSVPNADEARKVFDALSAGGQVNMPLSETFFSPCYGMLTDQFGLQWMVIVPVPMPC